MSLFYFLRNFFLCISLFFISANVYSTNYYVSQNGNDNDLGTSPSTSWQSISKVNSMMTSIVAGDQILFNRGDSFYGTVTITKSGTAGNEIVIGSYGNGQLPVITGKKLITGWTVHSGNIYKTTLSQTDTVANLYINDLIMTKARYPNSGFLRTDAAPGNTGFYDAALNQPSGFWNNADCKIRTKNWTYEIRKVSNYGGGNVIFSSPTFYSNYPNYGYYFDNKLELLDVQNEWHFDKSTNTLYFYAPGGVNPNTLQIEAVILKYGIYANTGTHFLKVKDLKISGFHDIGVEFYGGNNKTINGCYINQTGIFGVRMNGLNHVIEGNTFEDNLSSGLTGVITGGIVRNNTFNRTGLVAGYGNSGSGYVSIQGSGFLNSVIEYNNVDSSGYNGIGISKNNLLKNNVIDYSCLVLNDGGGIDITNNCDSLKIIGNMVYNTIGNFESSNIAASYSCGIYVNGAIMTNTTIQGNTVCFSRYMGILVDHKNTPNNNRISDNTCYNNFSSQVLFTDYSAVNFVPTYNTNFKNNILYSLSADQASLQLRGHKASGISDFGTFDSNYYYNPYSEYVVRRVNFLPTFVSNVFTLSSWQNNYNKDLNSKSSLNTFQQFGITDTLSGNLISNPQFDSVLYPWNSWPSGASLEWNNNPLLDNGSLKLKWNGIGYTIGFASSSGFPISIGNNYLVSVSSAGDHSGTFCLWGFSSIPTNSSVFPQTFFSYDNVRKDNSLIFKSEINDPQAYMSIGLILPDSAAYFDNVNMYQVNIEKIDSSQVSKLFVNNNAYPLAISLNGINYEDLDGNPVTGSILLQPFTSKILINGGFIPSRKLDLKVFIEGLYDPVTNKMVSDTATVFIRSSSSPYSVIDSIRTVLDSNGFASIDSYNAFNSTNYYLSVKHRNSMETWSGSTVMFNGNSLTYDFTTSANKSFGNNAILIGSKYCIYSGDVIKDGQIELSDVLQISNAANNFVSGYKPEDLNGDGVADLTDLQIVYNNSAKFVRISRP